MDGGCDISSMFILNECSGPLWRWHVVLLTCVVLVGDSLSRCCLHWWCCCQCLCTWSMVGVGSVCGCATSACTHPSMPIVHFLGWSSLGVLPACTIVIIFCCSQKYLPACLQGWPHDAMKVIVVDLCCASLSRPFCCATWPPWLSDVMDKVWNVCTSCEEQWCSLFCVSALEAWIWGWMNEWMLSCNDDVVGTAHCDCMALLDLNMRDRLSWHCECEWHTSATACASGILLTLLSSWGVYWVCGMSVWPDEDSVAPCSHHVVAALHMLSMCCVDDVQVVVSDYIIIACYWLIDWLIVYVCWSAPHQG